MHDQRCIVLPTYHLYAHTKPRQDRQRKCEATRMSSVQSVKSAWPIADWGSRGRDLSVGDSEKEYPYENGMDDWNR